ncbi:MAG: GNAT family N-acetyltransferase [Candidatus Thorarchaeota archaeon]
MDIRVFEPSDIKDAVKLANLYASFDSEVSEVDFQPAWSFPEGFLIADICGQVVGFIFAYLRDVPSEVLHRWHASKAAQIELLVVHPSFRGRDIGDRLLRRLLDTLKDESVDIVLLHCPTQSIEAKNLYDKYGFEVRAYAMKKRL